METETKHRKPGHVGTFTVHAPDDHQPRHRAPLDAMTVHRVPWGDGGLRAICGARINGVTGTGIWGTYDGGGYTNGKRRVPCATCGVS